MTTWKKWQIPQNYKRRSLCDQWAVMRALLVPIVNYMTICWEKVQINIRRFHVVWAMSLGYYSINQLQNHVWRQQCKIQIVFCQKHLESSVIKQSTIDVREIASMISCCLLPRCEALRTCRSGFPIATLPSRRCDQRRTASMTGVASFSTAGYCFSQECSVRDMHAIGQPPCDRITAIA